MTAATLSPAIALFVASAGLTAAQAKTLHPDYQLLRGEVQHYGDWLVGCDNSASCKIIGFPQQAGRGAVAGGHARPMALEITLSGPIGSDPVVHLLPFGETANGADASAPAQPYSLDVDYGKSAAPPLYGFSRYRLGSDEALAVLARLQSGQPFLGVAANGGKVIAQFPLKDFARAFRAMLARRADLFEQIEQAVFVPGELPGDRDMPAPGPLRRIAAIPVMVSGLVPITTQNTCQHSITRNLKRYSFQGGSELWSYECAGSIAAGKTFFAMSKSVGKDAVPLDLPEPRLGKIAAGRDGLTTSGFHFDWDFGVLRHYQFHKDHDDCGAFRAWGYTSEGWYLIERREMPICGTGISPEGWISTYRATVLNAPEPR